MKTSEMNSNELKVFVLVRDYCNEYFGGYQNTLEDTCPGDEYYEDAKAALTDSFENICNCIEGWVRASMEWQRIDNLHFVSLAWMRERIEKRVKKYIAEAREDYPEIF